jgi:anti-sigma factor RsiW
VEAGEVYVMNCQEFWNSMPELDGSEAARHAHLNDCPACASRMNRQQELAAGLRAMSASYRGVGAPSRVESKLRSAFRAGAGLAPVRSMWTPSFAWAAACAIVLALALTLVRAGHPVSPVGAPSRGTEVATVADESQSDYEGFIPLPNAARLIDTEDVNVVRVEVPRSAMIALGLEVSPERASELVSADVMLGPDGLARAVRFLEAEGDL